MSTQRDHNQPARSSTRAVIPAFLGIAMGTLYIFSRLAPRRRPRKSSVAVVNVG